MNIFYLDEDLTLCAQYHTDRHVVKMCTETAQILSSAYYYTGQSAHAPYRLSHGNHPCCVWCRESVNNWLWLRRLGLALCAEYTYRYKKRHKCEDIMEKMAPPALLDVPKTPFRCVMDARYRISPDPVENYRNYYLHEKKHLFFWKGRQTPAWICAHDESGPQPPADQE